jgi:hypothetical protein
LLKTFATWLRTVFDVIPRSPAMSPFERPWAMSSRISFSRSVRSGNGSAAGERGAAKNSATRRAIEAPNTASPTAAARIADRISPRSASFGM